jgi:hypothetical protein
MLFVTRWVSLSLSVVICCVLIPSRYRNTQGRPCVCFVGRRPDIMSLSLALRIAGTTCEGSHAVALLQKEPRLLHSLLRFADIQGLCNQFVHRSAMCISAF